MGAKLGPSLRGKNTDMVFENRVLRRIFGPKRAVDHGENCIIMNFIACILH
jgi:hypothetical protein